MGNSFLGKWLTSKGHDADQAVLNELSRTVAEDPRVRFPIEWFRRVLADLCTAQKTASLAFLPREPSRKLLEGSPILRNEAPPFALRPYQQRWRKACLAVPGELCERGQLRTIITLGRADLPSLLNEVLAENSEGIEVRARQWEFDPDILRLLVRFTFYPELVALNQACESSHSRSHWHRADCPTCGNGVLLAELRGLDQQRYLRCGWCAASWHVPRVLCPFCANRDFRSLSNYSAPAIGTRWRVAACACCGSTLKTLTTLSRLTPERLWIEDALSLPLNLAVSKARA